MLEKSEPIGMQGVASDAVTATGLDAASSTPFFTIVSVTWKDAWSLTKSMRSLFRQSCKDYEYIVIDGASDDGTAGLIRFWQANSLVSSAVIERDEGVYDAMNKGIRLARGKYVCFLNAGDTFADDSVLERIRSLLEAAPVPLDGVLGWGELSGQIWSSWIASPSFRLSSLGFCHQALYVRADVLRQHPFDSRKFKTDSDTLQLARMYASGADIRIVPEVLAIRGGEPGISANLERTRLSIVGTMVEEYIGLDEQQANDILAFRRRCEGPERIQQLLAGAAPELKLHLAHMVLDTLFLRQSATLPAEMVRQLYEVAQGVVLADGRPGAAKELNELFAAQESKATMLDERTARKKQLSADIAVFSEQEKVRITRVKAAQSAKRDRGAYVVSMTSFPARLPTLHFVIQSLVEQSLPPEAIHVWLGKDEVSKRSYLPKALLDFEMQGLHVHFADKTCHQYDKFLHNSELNQSRPFVIVDDDVIYPPESMETLLRAHGEHPAAVIANRCHLMLLDERGQPEPYAKWPREVQLREPSLVGFPTGAGGVLYPPGFMQQSYVTDRELILEHAPYADDIWLKVCGLARGIPVMSTTLSQQGKWYLRYTPTMREGALHATNVDLGLNDRQMIEALHWLSKVRPTWRAEMSKATVG